MAEKKNVFEETIAEVTKFGERNKPTGSRSRPMTKKHRSK